MAELGEDLTVPRCAWRESFYCRYEGEYRQRHLEESRAGTERNKLNMANRVDWAIRGELRD